jgi:hypothetical protein
MSVLCARCPLSARQLGAQRHEEAGETVCECEITALQVLQMHAAGGSALPQGNRRRRPVRRVPGPGRGERAVWRPGAAALPQCRAARAAEPLTAAGLGLFIEPLDSLVFDCQQPQQR